MQASWKDSGTNCRD